MKAARFGCGRLLPLTAATTLIVLSLAAASLPADTPGAELRIALPAAGTAVGEQLRLDIHFSARSWDELDIKAILISPSLDMDAVRLIGDAPAAGAGSLHAVVSPDEPGEYDLSVIMRGMQHGSERSIRRSLNFRVAPGSALYIDGEEGEVFRAGRVYAGETAALELRVDTRRKRGRRAVLRLSALECESGHVLEAGLIDLQPSKLPTEDLPIDVTLAVTLPQDAPPGLYRGTFSMESETDRTDMPFEIEVLKPVISLSHDTVSLGGIRRGDAGRAELVIGLQGGVQTFGVTLQPWISRSGGHGPGMFVDGLDRTFTLSDGEQEIIAVSAYASRSTAVGRYHSALVIETPMRRLEVPVEARVRRVPVSTQQFLMYALMGIIVLLILMAIWDIVRSFRGCGLTPLQRFILLSALLHALLLLLSAYLLFDSVPDTERDRVAIRAVRIAGDHGPAGASAAADSFLGESEKFEEIESEHAVEVDRTAQEHVEEREPGTGSAELEEDIRELRRKAGQAGDGEIVDEAVEIARSAGPAYEDPEIDPGRVNVRDAAGPEAVEAARDVDIERAEAGTLEAGDRPAAPAMALPAVEPQVSRVAVESDRGAGVEIVADALETVPSPVAAYEEPDIDAGEVSLRATAEPDMPEVARPTDLEPLESASHEESPVRPEFAGLGDDVEIMRMADSDAGPVILAGPPVLEDAVGRDTPGLGDRISSGKLVIGHGIYDGDWDCELSAMPNLAYQIERRTGLAVEAETRFVRMGSDDISQSAFLFMTGHRDFRFRDEEIGRLREYLEGGGSLWINDSTHEGDETFDRAVRREIARLLPGIALETIPMDSALFTACYDLSRGYLGYDIPPGDKYRENRLRGLRFGDRWAVVYTRNDYGDGLEIDPNTHPLMESLTNLSPREMQEGSIRMGMNLTFYFIGSEGMDEAQERQLAQMQRTAADIPELEEQERRLLEGRPSVAAAQVMEVTQDWHVATDWSDDPTEVDPAPEGGIDLGLEPGAAGKNVVGKHVRADLSGYRWLVMRVESGMEAGARLAVGLNIGDEMAYFESAPRYLRPGNNPKVAFDLTSDTFKSQATGWEYTASAGNLEDVRSVHLLVYPIRAGRLVVEDIRFQE